jgi:tetratricopeptide (TPR) repeat protein
MIGILVMVFGLLGILSGPYDHAQAVSRLGDPYEDARTAYRAGDLEGAASLLAPLVQAGNADAMTLMGYVLYRQGKYDESETLFKTLYANNRGGSDVPYGLGLIAAAKNDLKTARKWALEAQKLDPSRTDVINFLATLPLGADEIKRPVLVKPKLTDRPFSASKGFLRGPDGKAIVVKGMNMGVALPGKFPSQFPTDQKTYLGWFESIGQMNANTLRLYTILPPAFYSALREYNLAHAKRPLYLIHGVWTELPEELDTTDLPTAASLSLHDYRGGFRDQFVAEIHRVIDVIHGRADIDPKPGHASGNYTADVSAWNLAYLVGREWEPYSIAAHNERKDAPTKFQGQFVKAFNVTPFEAWLADILDATVSYEMTKYNAQRPISTIGWPTTDPLRHITESSAKEEYAARRARGEPVPDVEGVTFNEDDVSIDMTKILATKLLPAGVFATYHAYPYYPDFLNNDPEYAKARSSFGASNYFGYLSALKKHHGDQALLIAEVGVPSSRANAHQQPQGWNHGTHSEERQAEIDVRLYNELIEAGSAGGIMFAWLDEWFKKNWLTYRLERPAERRPMWHSVMDAEQNYGVIAAEPLNPIRLGRAQSIWASKPVLTQTDGLRVKTSIDQEYVHVLIETPLKESDQLELMIDTHPNAGVAVTWAAPYLPEFRIRLGAKSGHLDIVKGYSPFAEFNDYGVAYRDFFTKASPKLILDASAQTDQAWEPWLTQTNRRRIGRNNVEYPAQYWDEGNLRQGTDPIAGRNTTVDYQWTSSGVQLRLPWTLLMVTDPSSRSIYDGLRKDSDLTLQIKDLGLNVRVANRVAPAARFSWPTWEEPTYQLRKKPAFEALRSLWALPINR